MKLKLPNFLHTPQFTIGPVRKVLSFLAKYKILILILIFLLALIAGAIWLRGYLAPKSNQLRQIPAMIHIIPIHPTIPARCLPSLHLQMIVTQVILIIRI